MLSLQKVGMVAAVAVPLLACLTWLRRSASVGSGKVSRVSEAVAISQPSPGWCVQLTGHPMDLDSWAHELSPPFDPWIEKTTHGADEVQLLRSSAFESVDAGADAQALGRSLLDQLNGALQITSGQTAEIALGASVYVDSTGATRFHHFVQPEPVVCRVRFGVAAITVHDADGNLVPPPPPKASAAQRWIGAPVGDGDARTDLLVYLGRADNWFDLFKAYEVVRRLAGSEDNLSQLANVRPKDIDDLRRTANYYRHAGGHHTLPNSPPTIGEARTMLNTLAQAVLDASANGGS